ncbi:MAG: dephospho-CoA kinase [Saprospirales bacterium]|nr:MAG: dephospho-CoA kinase [Saprospirales bacterium]
MSRFHQFHRPLSSFAPQSRTFVLSQNGIVLSKYALKVGVTGGIGSGKTTVCRIFESLGVPVYYADDRARTLLNTDADIHRGLKSIFGERVFGADGRPDRKYIASVVFEDKEKLAKLNKLIHPAVGADWEAWYSRIKADYPYVLKEAALLFESGSYRNLDRVICVAAPESLRIERVVKRDGVDEAAVRSRMKNQLNQDMKISLSHHLIKNDGTLSLIKQVVSLHRQLSKGG